MKFWNRFGHFFSSIAAKQKLRRCGVKFGRGLITYGIPIISVKKNSRVELGDNVILCSWSDYTALGVNHPTVIRTLMEDAEIFIGDDVGISGGTICAAKRIVIGSYSLLGANVMIMDNDFHPLLPEGRRYNKDFENIKRSDVIIDENVFIGANAIVLKGVHIGKNVVIGAGSVVTSDIPENVIAAGNPCKVLRGLYIS